MTVLNLRATQDHIEKVASTRDPIKAIAEFVWNSLDADATEVAVEFPVNALGGIEAIIIKDNGIGISKQRADHDFEALGDSWKRAAHHTPELHRALHGREGRGRFRFYSLADRARWDTTYDGDGRKFSLKIEILAGSLARANVSEPSPAIKEGTGTSADLSPLKAAYDWLLTRDAYLEFSTLFAPYVLQYPSVTISFGGKKVEPREVIDRAQDFPKQMIVTARGDAHEVTMKVIEWKSHVESRKIHLGGDDGIVLGSQAAHIIAPEFEFSAYAYSKFFQELADANLLEFDGLSDPDFARLMLQIRDTLNDYFKERRAERSGSIIDELKSEGAYPYEGEPKDDIERVERNVFDIATFAVSSYSKDFRKADTSLKRLTLALLREAFRHNPDAISTILHAVANLPKNRQEEFSLLLGRAELGNIIAAGSMIAERVIALEVLKSMVFNPEYKDKIKERGELDAIVRDNTWIFGEHFHITLPEAGLTKVMERVHQEVALGKVGKKVRKLDGRAGRIDCFLGRSVPLPYPHKREYLVVELKRPSSKIGRAELDQLEDYVNSIIAQPDYLHADTYWHFYLVTADHHDEIANRITQKDRPPGLFLEGVNFKVWVKTWSTLTRECEARLKFVQEKLNVQVSDAEIGERIGGLRAILLKQNKPEKPAKASKTA